MTPCTPLSGGYVALPSLSFLAAGPVPRGRPERAALTLVPTQTGIWSPSEVSLPMIRGPGPATTRPRVGRPHWPRALSVYRRRDARPGGRDENRPEEFLPAKRPAAPEGGSPPGLAPHCKHAPATSFAHASPAQTWGGSAWGWGTVRERAGLLTWSPDPKGTSQPPVADPRDFPAADRPALPAARRPLPVPHATTRRLGHTLNAPTKAPGGASAGSRRARGPLT